MAAICGREQPLTYSRLQHILLLLAFLFQLAVFGPYYCGYLWYERERKLLLSAPSNSFFSSHTNVYHNDTFFSPSPGEIIRSSRSMNGYRASAEPDHSLPRTVYLEYAWNDLHSEIFYSIIREFCGKFLKDAIFLTDDKPTFYLGPVHRITSPALEIWREFNQTMAACGPIHIDTPKNPDLTVLTTTYAHATYTPEFVARYVNNSKFLIICHDKNQEMESASNVFWLTPLHRNYFIPNYFPPSFVARRHQKLRQRRRLPRSSVPVFLVLGKATPRKRNIQSLIDVLRHYRYERFTVRIMGKMLPPAFNKSMYCKQAWCDKIEYVRLPNPFDFMLNVTDVDAILPLVDETNFYTTFQGGKKLSSSVMWGLGFDIPLILYRELAYVYNVKNGLIYDEHPLRKHLAPNATHWPSRQHKRTFKSCFGEFLRRFSF